MNFQGVLIFYVNYNFKEGQDQESQADLAISLVKNYNEQFLDKMTEKGYEVAFVPVTGESTRIEKVDFPQIKEDND